MTAFRRRSGITAAYLFFLYATLGITRPAVELLRSSNLLRLSVAVLFIVAVPAVLGWRAASAGWKRLCLRSGVTALTLAAAFLLAGTPEEWLHFLTYGLLGWLIAWSLEGQSSGLLLPFLLVWLAGTGDELIQAFLPNRVFDFRDILFNGMAGMAGIAVFATAGPPAPSCP